MTFFIKTFSIALAASLSFSAVQADEARIAQIGDNQTAANISFGTRNTLATIQQGDFNQAAQIVSGKRNTAGVAQVGLANASATVISGERNTVGTAQLGVLHRSNVLIDGKRNTVGTLQVGFGHTSNVTIDANRANVSVEQYGLKPLTSNLTVVDELAPPSTPQQGLTASLAANRGLDVSVYQPPGSPEVNATVARTRNAVIVQPGSATTVFTLTN